MVDFELTQEEVNYIYECMKICKDLGLHPRCCKDCFKDLYSEFCDYYDVEMKTYEEDVLQSDKV